MSFLRAKCSGAPTGGDIISCAAPVLVVIRKKVDAEIMIPIWWYDWK